MVKLLHGDCLELMKGIESGSVDLILTDPPYGTTACKWDSVIPFKSMWEQINRIKKRSSTVVLFGSEPFSSLLRCSNLKQYKYDWIWEKEQSSSGLFSNREPMKVHENISVFFDTLSSDTRDSFCELKEYMISEFEKTGISREGIRVLLGNYMASHYFTTGSQFTIPTEENYKKLQTTGFFKKPYSEVLKEYVKEYENFKTIYNPQMETGKPFPKHIAKNATVHGGISHIVNVNNGTRYPRSVIKFNREKGLHPTQKPVKLLRYLIKTYSNRGDTILDFTMGSGSTGVACIQEDRNFIGIEKDDNYFKVAQDRINKAQTDKDGITCLQLGI